LPYPPITRNRFESICTIQVVDGEKKSNRRGIDEVVSS